MIQRWECCKSESGEQTLITANKPTSTHWGRVMHICVGKLTTIGSENGLSPGRRQAIIWTNAGILLIWTLGTNFSEISSEIHAFSFKKMHLKMSSAKWRPFCLGFNVLSGFICILGKESSITGRHMTTVNWALLAASAPDASYPVTRDNCNTLLWCHNGRDGVSNRQPHECLLNRLFRRR